MGLVLPAELKWLEWIVGSDWPEGDETAMRRCAEAWSGAGADVDDLAEDLRTTASRVLGTVEGESADAFRAYFDKYIKTDPQYLPKLAQACEKLAATLNGGANEIEYAKYMFIALLTITAIEITHLIATATATLGGSTAAIPAVESAAQITSRSIAQQLLVAIGKGAARGLLEHVLLDLGIQAVQVAEGHRDGIDLATTGAAALGGAVGGAAGGAISGGAGLGMGEAPGMGEAAGDTVLSGMAGDVTAEGMSGPAGTGADTMMYGESMSAEDLAGGDTSGAFGDAAGGAEGGPDGLGVQDVDVPLFGAGPGAGSPGAAEDPDVAAADADTAGDQDLAAGPAAHTGGSETSSHAADHGATVAADHTTSYQPSAGSGSYGGGSHDSGGSYESTDTGRYETSLAGAETPSVSSTVSPAPAAGVTPSAYTGGSSYASVPSYTSDGSMGGSAGAGGPGGPTPDGSSSAQGPTSAPSSGAPASGGPASPAVQSPSGTSSAVPSGGGTPRMPDGAATPIGAALAGGGAGAGGGGARSHGPAQDGVSLSSDGGPPLPDETFESPTVDIEQDDQTWSTADGGTGADGDSGGVVPVIVARGFGPSAAATGRPASRATRRPSATGRPASAGRTDGTGSGEDTGTPGAPGEGPVSSPNPDRLPPHLHEVYRSSVETPAGRSFFTRAEQSMRDLARRVPADPDRYVVDGCGDPEGMRIGDRHLGVGDVAGLIRYDPNWSGREVMLISDEVGDGPDSFATRLSCELGVPVTAPDGLAWTDDDSRVFASFGAYDTSETSTAIWPPDGGWSVHNPNGTIAGTGRGAFSPGHPEPPGARPGTPPPAAVPAVEAVPAVRPEVEVRPDEHPSDPPGPPSGAGMAELLGDRPGEAAGGSSAEASAGPVADGLRLAPVFATTDADRPPVEPAERDRLLAYLERAPIVLAARGFDTDRLHPTAPRDVPMTFHTDGTWVWSGAVVYYLRHHDVAPDPSLVAHIQARGFRVSNGDDGTRAEAVSLITGAPAAR